MNMKFIKRLLMFIDAVMDLNGTIYSNPMYLQAVHPWQQ